MRFLCSIVCVLALSWAVYAADTTSAAPAAETPAPAPKTAPAAVACPAPFITWSGLAMLRLREEIVSNNLKNGTDQENANYSYQIAYHFGAKIKANDQLTMGFDIGNDWYATELVTGIPGNYWKERDPYTPWFDLAYAQWDPGYLHLAAGIIPVKGSALMDLLGVSIFFNKSYHNAAHVPWGVVTNFSQTGLRLGAPILNDAFKLGVDLTSATIQYRAIGLGIDTMLSNSPATEFLLEIPMNAAGFSIKPQSYIIPNRSFSAATKKSDMEFGAGIDLGYKISDQLNLRAGFGYANNSNNNSFNAASDTAFDHTGTNSNIGTTVVLGPGKLDVDFNVSTENNAKDTTQNAVYPFADFKYGWAVNKNFVIMPRCRFFITVPKVTFNTETTIRPELILAGSF
jgi:opacity protein-like surface antigen